ncbi:YibE/F family protein [Actinopolyspora halophila]|uniref:YibE/F family protein n=1 Tax=Actinopolyspora halophila TaxID=1850 RepID=UPI00037A3177|nr:YibE/F family protein [Actinopolyspora halophila]
MPDDRSSEGIPQLPDHDHGHGHGHDAPPASNGTRMLLAAVLAPFVLAALIGALVLYPFGEQPSPAEPTGFGRTPVDGLIVDSDSGACALTGPGNGSAASGPSGSGSQEDCLRLRIELRNGPAAGATIEQNVPVEPTTPEFEIDDEVVLAYSGTAPRQGTSYQIVDYQRGHWMLLLFGLFAGAVVVLGRWKGVASLLALGVAFAVIAGFVLPAVLAGRSPLQVAVVGAGLIMFFVLYFTHGLSARTSTAVLGTLSSLTLIGLLSSVFAALTQLTGLDDSTSALIGALGHDIDARGLLLAGIVIGALGVLDDVTITQTSAVWELHRANPDLRWRQLYSAALRIGRDHVASSVNTLVLAYAGTALPLLLTYSLSGRSFVDIVTTQDVAQEVVRTLVGSLGLIAAVPLTTAIAALIVMREKRSEAPRGKAQGTDAAELIAHAARLRAARTTFGAGSPPAAGIDHPFRTDPGLELPSTTTPPRATGGPRTRRSGSAE